MRSKGPAGGLAGPRQASPRTLAIAGGIVVVVAVAIVLGVVLSKSSGNNGPTNGSGDALTIRAVTGTPKFGSSTGPTALSGAPDVEKMFKGIPQTQFVLGYPSAPVELTEFIDLQCPICKDFETTALPTLVSKYVRTGKLRIKMEPWQILDRPGTGVTDSRRGQKATIAAANQNRAFNFAEILYINQGQEDSHWMTDSFIAQAAASVDGLDTGKLVTDANSSATQQIVTAVTHAGNQVSNEVTAAGQQPGTPTLLLAKGIEKPKLYGVGMPDLGQLEAAINALLK